MIAETFMPQGGAARTVASCIRLSIYMVSPKPGQREYLKGERVACAPRFVLMAPGVALPTVASKRWAADISREMKRLVCRARGLRTAPRHLFHHIAFSFHPDDSIRLGKTSRQQGEIAIEVVKRVLQSGGLAGHPAVLVAHADTRHVHVHVVVASCTLKGKIWSPGRRSFRRLESALDRAEKTLGLVRVAGRRNVFASGSAPYHATRQLSYAEVRREKETGQESARTKLRNLLGPLLDHAHLEEFANECRSQGIFVLPRIVANRVAGVSYRRGSYVFSGSELGREYAWPQVRHRLRIDLGNPSHQAVLKTWRRDDRILGESLKCEITALTRMAGTGLGRAPQVASWAALRRGLVAEEAGSEMRLFWAKSKRLAIRVNETTIQLTTPSLRLLRIGLALAFAKGWGAIRILAPGFAKSTVKKVAKSWPSSIQLAFRPTPIDKVLRQDDQDEEIEADPRAIVNEVDREALPPVGEEIKSRYREEARARSRGMLNPRFPTQ